MTARNELTLQREIEVIDYNIRKNSSTAAEKSPRFSTVHGRTQIHTIIKKKEAILSEYEGNAPASRKFLGGGEFSDISEALAAKQGGSNSPTFGCGGAEPPQCKPK